MTVLEGPDGKIGIEYQGRPLSFKLFSQQEVNGEIVNSKEIDRFINKAKNHKKVSINHPWNQQGRAEAKRKNSNQQELGV